MSFKYDEIRDRGLPYGSIPYSEILSKFEETNTDETPDDFKNGYDKYLRSEIIDRTLDKPFLESDKPRRDSSISTSVLNLRYNGSRGEYERPVHPEMFVGFMDQDPRGLDNLPNMNQYKSQINTRMPNLEIRMGVNNTDHLTERPWTNQDQLRGRQDLQTSLKHNTKVFTDERDGRALNQNLLVQYNSNKPNLVYPDLLPTRLTSDHNPNKGSIKYSNQMPLVNHDYSVAVYSDTENKTSQVLSRYNLSNVNCDHTALDSSYARSTNYSNVMHVPYPNSIGKLHNNGYTNAAATSLYPGSKQIQKHVSFDAENTKSLETMQRGQNMTQNNNNISEITSNADNKSFSQSYANVPSNAPAIANRGNNLTTADPMHHLHSDAVNQKLILGTQQMHQTSMNVNTYSFAEPNIGSTSIPKSVDHSNSIQDIQYSSQQTIEPKKHNYIFVEPDIRKSELTIPSSRQDLSHIRQGTTPGEYTGNRNVDISYLNKTDNTNVVQKGSHPIIINGHQTVYAQEQIYQTDDHIQTSDPSRMGNKSTRGDRLSVTFIDESMTEMLE